MIAGWFGGQLKKHKGIIVQNLNKQQCHFFSSADLSSFKYTGLPGFPSGTSRTNWVMLSRVKSGESCLQSYWPIPVKLSGESDSGVESLEAGGESGPSE